MRESSIRAYPVSDREVKSFLVAVVRFNWLCSFSSCAITLLFWFFFVLHALFFFSPHWLWVARQCSFIYRLNSAVVVLYTRQAEIHNLKEWNNGSRKTFAGILHSSVFCNLGRIKGETLQSHLFNHTLARSLALPLPPENWISPVVVCDVPVPDKSLLSPCACAETQTHTLLMLAFWARCLFFFVCKWLDQQVFSASKDPKEKINLVLS